MSLSSSAITAALDSAWDEAIDFNEEILVETPNDIAALNRLAYAFLESGKVKKAQKFYRLALRLDPHNSIAQKNLQKICEFSTKNVSQNKQQFSLQRPEFLEEPGKTKIVNLVNIASRVVLSQLRPGSLLILCPKKHNIVLTDDRDNYVGSLPDDLSYRLKKFIKGGNRYEAYVKSVTKNSLFVFLREVSRSKKYMTIPSFSTRLDISRLGSLEKTSREDFSLKEEEVSSSTGGDAGSIDMVDD